MSSQQIAIMLWYKDRDTKHCYRLAFYHWLTPQLLQIKE